MERIRHPLKSLSEDKARSDRVEQNVDDRTWATTDTVELELILLMGSFPSWHLFCETAQWTVLEPRGKYGEPFQRDLHLLLRAFRFCFECRKSRIFYRTWKATVKTILPGESENVRANLILIFLTPMAEKFCLNGSLILLPL